MKYDFDVIIVGAGPAGSILSKILAEGGFKVALIEKKRRNEIGYPWEITVEKQILGKLCLKSPDFNSRPEHPEYYRFFSHNMDDYLEMKAEDDAIYYFFHHQFNQQLLSMAIRGGVSFFERHEAKGLILNDNYACGVRGERREWFLLKEFKLTGKIIVDASGSDQVLCKQTPDDFMIQTDIRKEDWVSAWQQVQLINADKIKECEETLNISPGVAYLRVGKYHAYQVLHYRRNKTLNLVFGGVINNNSPTANEQCRDFIDTYPYFKRKLYGGGKNIATRRSIDTMVGNGFACLGDAACQVVPTTGSGVTSALYSADILAKTIANAINSGDFSIKNLWHYNHYYQSKRGAILASYDIIRLFMQGLRYDQITSIFDSHLLKDSNFITIYSSNRIVYNIQQIFENFSTIISHAELIPIGVHMIRTIRDTRKIIKLYESYPSTYDKNRFLSWRQHVNAIFARYYPGGNGAKPYLYRFYQL